MTNTSSTHSRFGLAKYKLMAKIIIKKTATRNKQKTKTKTKQTNKQKTKQTANNKTLTIDCQQTKTVFPFIQQAQTLFSLLVQFKILLVLQKCQIWKTPEKFTVLSNVYTVICQAFFICGCLQTINSKDLLDGLEVDMITCFKSHKHQCVIYKCKKIQSSRLHYCMIRREFEKLSLCCQYNINNVQSCSS